MSCPKAASCNLLVVVLVISLLALDRPIAHARHLKSTSMSSPDSSPAKGLEGDPKKKLDEEKNTKKVQTVQAGSSSSVDLASGSPGVDELAKIVVVDLRGPTPHPKKHNL
uniref:Uncharacterized protein n=2 Tax=Oryza brachyantha TaxID=4533 RepID=J3LE84_ORYBR